MGNYRQTTRIERRGANEKREGLKENIKMGSFEQNFFVVISNFKALLEHFYLKMARLCFTFEIKIWFKVTEVIDSTTFSLQLLRIITRTSASYTLNQ